MALEHYREVLQARLKEDEDYSQEISRKQLFAYEDDVLSKCDAGIDLTQSKPRQIISDILMDMHNELIYLYAFTIMPNHIHLLFRPLEREGHPIPLAYLVRKFKGNSAVRINKALGREGKLWYREYYDHWIRNQEELSRVIEYIINNPVKAGLCKSTDKWPGTWVNPEFWSD